MGERPDLMGGKDSRREDGRAVRVHGVVARAVEARVWRTV